ncbi:aminotransferase class I/II-fold pyridoxal phosphate-dependent enzyme [Rubrobacter tropicus]|uniref:Aminotransferase class I/II-fold pyridoxal phosphate-dependent enzyme n=1 Tax=Rubrobacter tropicus TaxID=2653851 RepID=A0A6G8Q4Q5_9ACTN|nr:aminotransferase class I/II-fold pyridoxal phosphate-dependent enzyme [Rubrobacter tropicus]QIN81446.1 aminotransferase class I/II-fold pyridoxal phosphate-dependent enzyme [Rubrobacter tropicus]
MVLHKGGRQEVPDDLRPPFPDDEVEPDTLIDLLVHRASHQARDQAFMFLEDGESAGDFVDYAGLDGRARDVAARLQALGVETGERVLLFYPPGLDYAAAFLGCLYAGVVAVPAYPPRLNRPISRLRSIATDSGATVALAPSPVLSNLEKRLAHAPEMRSLRWLSTDDGEDRAEAWRRPEVDADTLAFLQYTSGSTSSPKGVMVTHGNLLHNLALIYHGFGHSAGSHMVSWLPPYHDMGLIVGILQPLYGGFPATLMPPASFMQRPLGWLRAISRTGADSAGAPNFAYDLCARVITPEERATLDLSGWKLAFSGAEPIRRETLERFAEAFAPCGFRWEAFYPAYGLAEATVFVSGGRRQDPPVVLPLEGAELERDRVAVAASDGGQRSIVGCGRAPADQEIVVVDPKTLTVCPPDRVGEVWVSGPSVAQGYWGRPEETKDTFGAYLADTGEGTFLRTGDLGFLHHGELFITGRLNDLIIVRGRNHYPQDIELTAEQSHAALRPDCSAAFSVDIDGDERLVIVHELERSHVKNVDADEVAAAVRSAVADLHELEAHTIVLVRTGSIPKTSSGKIQRRATRAAYLEGSLPVVATDELSDDAGRQDTEEEGDPVAPEVAGEADRVLDTVGDFVRRRGRTEPVRPSDSLRGDLGLDSLAIAEMLMDLESAFEVRMGDSVIADSRTAEDVVGEVLRARQTDAGGPSESDGIAGLQERIFRQIPQLGAVVNEQDGRSVKIGGRWCADFASANYLGLDLHPEVLAAIPDAIRRWGVHPSWTRAVASPQIYDDLERELADFVGVPDVLVFPTITLLHSGVLPVLAGADGLILLDRAVHTSMQEAAYLAKARGTAVDWFDHNDPQDLERVLELHRGRPRKIIAVDGVYSMSGAYPPLPEFARLARKHEARVYVDDAHGIGVVGENPTPDNPYGDWGNGIVRHLGLRYGREIVYVGGMSKAFSSMAAFVSCSDEDEKRRLAMASTAVFSGPCPTASLASALAGLKISRRDEGSAIRRRLLRLTRDLVDGARALGFAVDNNERFPLVGVRIGDVDAVIRACNVLWDHGILLTPALYPAVPMDRGALRFTVTAANTEEQVQRAIEGLRRVREEVFPHGHPSALAASAE